MIQAISEYNNGSYGTTSEYWGKSNRYNLLSLDFKLISRQKHLYKFQVCYSGSVHPSFTLLHQAGPLYPDHVPVYFSPFSLSPVILLNLSCVKHVFPSGPQNH